MNSSRYSTSSVYDDSINDGPLLRIISKTAEEEAQRQVLQKYHLGLFRCKADYEGEFDRIYRTEYRKTYQQYKRLQELAAIGQMSVAEQHNGSGRQGRSTPEVYNGKHAYGKFTKRNFIVHIQEDCITVSRILPELADQDAEMRDVFINNWPGPLLAQKTNNYQVIDYMKTIQQHVNLEPLHQIIWNLLMKIIYQAGVISGADIAELLLHPEDTKINERDDLFTVLHKHLFLGKRRAAIKYACQPRLWELAQSLAFLDKNQLSARDRFPPQLDDPMLQVNIDFVYDMEKHRENYGVLLPSLYKSLLNNLLIERGRPISPVTARTDQQFAILIANECEIQEYDTSNELYKLIIALRKRDKSHIIHLEFPVYNYNTSGANIEEVTNIEDVSDRSLTSFMPRADMPNVPCASLMCLNEIWEYALNLTMGTSNPYYDQHGHDGHEHLINLVPHRLVFASKLLDYGYTELCCQYLDVVKRTISHTNPDMGMDPKYDWQVLRQAIEALDQIIRLCKGEFSQEEVERQKKLIEQERYQREVLEQQRRQEEEEKERLRDQQEKLQREQQRLKLEQQRQKELQEQSEREAQRRDVQLHQQRQLQQEQQQQQSQQQQSQQQQSQQQQENQISGSPSIPQSPTSIPSLPLLVTPISPPSQPQPQLLPPPPQPVQLMQFQPPSVSKPMAPQPHSNGLMAPKPQTQSQFQQLPQTQFAQQNQPHAPRSESSEHQARPQSNAQIQQTQKNKQTNNDRAANNEGGLVNRLFRGILRPNKNEMHLPDDNQKTLVEGPNGWVDTSESGQQDNNMIAQGPPRGNIMAPGQHDFRKRYVNPWDQQQQKQLNG